MNTTVISPNEAASDWSLVLFTRWPVAGKTKTRLIPRYGAHGAANIHRQLIARTIATAQALPRATDIVVAVAEAPQETDTTSLFPAHWPILSQHGSDLGERMANAIDDTFLCRQQAQSIVLIGVDCPGYSPELLQDAAACLQTRNVVFAPTEDGGYGLVGVQRRSWNHQTRCALFENIAWGSSAVMQTTLTQLRARTPPLTVAQLSTIWDVDTPVDVERAVAAGAIRPPVSSQ